MNVPRLRFKEYEGHWLSIQIGNIGEIITGSTPDTTESAYYNGSKLFVTPVDITSSRYVYETKTRLTEAGFKKGRLVKANSVLFVCIGSTIGKVAQNRFDCITNQQINAITPSSNFSPEFVYSRLENDAKKISLLAGEQAVPIINKTSFSKVTIYVPELPEQTKIANFLTAVDEKISQLTQKCDLLKQYKKGVMQQIFSQKLRFKDDDGCEFPEWEEKELGDVIEQMQSGVSRLLNDSDIGLPVIRSTNLIDGKLNISDLKYWYTIDNQGVNLENYFLKEGDLLVNFINSLAQIGKVAIYEDLLKRKTIFTTNILRLSFKKDVNFKFIFCFFQTNDYEQHIQAITKPAVNQASFTTKEFKTLKIPFPSLPEQTKIANFLTAIDDKITQTQTQLDAVKLYKKGLLQQLFV